MPGRDPAADVHSALLFAPHVLNNPINASDPSGHKCIGEPDECKKEDDKPINGAGGLEKLKSNKDDERNEEDALERQLQYCLQHPNIAECSIAKQETITPLKPKYDFVGFWELNRLDALGIRLNGTACFIIICGDLSIDVIGNFDAGEATLFVTPNLAVGLGYGVDGSAGILGAFDAPHNNSLAGPARNFSVNITPGVGGQGSYSVSTAANITGNYSQVYSLGVTGGGEASGVYGASYSFPIGTCDRANCYFGVK
jgi:hypothetical protein